MRIVVGYDGSDSAHRAADEAATLADGLGAELHVVTVVADDPKRRALDVTAVDELATDAVEARSEGLREQAAATAGRLVDAYPGVEVVAAVEVGPPARSLVAYAERIEADIIVVGNRRVQGIERLLGSVAIDVLRHAPCSVHVAKTV